MPDTIAPDMVAAAIQAPAISLADATGGLIVGNIGGDLGGELASVALATRVATEASISAVKV
ncbi:hypothetical protein ABTB92_20575, partial [Acinetobacter baumannii]